jgi:transcriptional regulator GlxA family with amidase domain
MTKTIGIYIFDDVEVLDFAGPFEVFSTAARVQARLTPDAPKLFNVVTIAEQRRLLRARGGLAIMPEADIDDHPWLDVLVVPGGVMDAELQKPELLTWLDAGYFRSQARCLGLHRSLFAGQSRSA